MKIDILSLFPQVFSILDSYGVVGKAIQKEIISYQALNIRDFSLDKHKKVDDTIFGGEAGMLMTPQPIVSAIEACKSSSSKVIYLSPQGSLLNQKKCIDLAKEEHLILLCGHYEGVDSRVVNHFVDEEISIGDYVLTGGELPALILIDAISRFVKGVLGNEDSLTSDSHYDLLLQYDEFTKPRNFRGLEVPPVLLSGNHEKIKAWRQASSIENTKNKRPDLYKQYEERLVEGGRNGLLKTT